jgi:hypothetical protein
MLFFCLPEINGGFIVLIFLCVDGRCESIEAQIRACIFPVADSFPGNKQSNQFLPESRHWHHRL